MAAFTLDQPLAIFIPHRLYTVAGRMGSRVLSPGGSSKVPDSFLIPALLKDGIDGLCRSSMKDVEKIHDGQTDLYELFIEKDLIVGRQMHIRI